MDDQAEPVAWTALEKGAAVFDSSGADVGKLTVVVADEQRDIFSGIAFRSGLLDSERFAPAATIQRLTRGGIFLSLTSEETLELEHYER